MTTLYRCEPVLKVCEYSVSDGGKAYLRFEEDVDIPGLKGCDVRFEFNRNNSLEDMKNLAAILKNGKFSISVQKI